MLPTSPSPDTIVSNPYNPQSLNRYAYALNNPIRYTDPTGHVCQDYDLSGHVVGVCLTGGRWADIPQGKTLGNWYNNPKPQPTEEGTASGGNGGDKQKLWDDSWMQFNCSDTDLGCVGEQIGYFAFTGGTTIPNPYTGTVVGWHTTIVLDQYGQWYVGGGLDAGKNILGWDASLVEGRFSHDQLPSDNAERSKFLENFITGNSFQGFLVPIIYFGANYSPSVNNAAWDLGIGSPQGGIAWTYTFKVSK